MFSLPFDFRISFGFRHSAFGFCEAFGGLTPLGRLSPCAKKIMWIRRCQIDARLEAPLPIPTQIASNEEFIPPPQSLEQRKVEALTLHLA